MIPNWAGQCPKSCLLRVRFQLKAHRPALSQMGAVQRYLRHERHRSVCELPSPGSYSHSAMGQMSATSCQLCSEGQYSTPGAAGCHYRENTCPVGTKAISTGSCVPVFTPQNQQELVQGRIQCFGGCDKWYILRGSLHCRPGAQEGSTTRSLAGTRMRQCLLGRAVARTVLLRHGMSQKLHHLSPVFKHAYDFNADISFWNTGSAENFMEVFECNVVQR